MTVNDAARGAALQLQVLIIACVREETNPPALPYATRTPADVAAEVLGNCLANLGHAIAREARHGVDPAPPAREG